MFSGHSLSLPWLGGGGSLSHLLISMTIDDTLTKIIRINFLHIGASLPVWPVVATMMTWQWQWHHLKTARTHAHIVMVSCSTDLIAHEMSLCLSLYVHN